VSSSTIDDERNCLRGGSFWIVSVNSHANFPAFARSMNERLKVSRKDSAMKITIGPLSFDILLFFRLWLAAHVFFGLCIGIFVAFDSVLLLIDQIAPPSWLNLLIGTAWLLLLIFYILLGVAFISFVARFLRRSSGLEEARVQRRMALLSGLPFYALCLLFLMACIYGALFPDRVGGPAAFASVAGFIGFALVSCGYLLLLRFFLGRSTAIAHQEKEK